MSILHLTFWSRLAKEPPQKACKRPSRKGDAEQLPYPDAQFDLVMTMFGAMFAPRPERAASELARVCRRGGMIAMANWTPEGFVGKVFSLTSRYVPPPEGIPAPVLWDNERL